MYYVNGPQDRNHDYCKPRMIHVMKPHPQMTDEQVRWYISTICDRIRAKTAVPYEWAFLREYGHPALFHAMLRYVIRRAAGLES